ncbi:MAG: hypothetical protein ACLPTZ_08735 [Beijerinckiaceae bacterium]
MLRTVLTLALTIAALFIAMTARGLALLGSNRPALMLALAALGVLQAYRLFSAWQKRKQNDRLNKIPRRPLGI